MSDKEFSPGGLVLEIVDELTDLLRDFPGVLREQQPELRKAYARSQCYGDNEEGFEQWLFECLIAKRLLNRSKELMATHLRLAEKRTAREQTKMVERGH